MEKVIALQKVLTLKANQQYIGKVIKVLVEKESKKSFNQWAGRSDGNTWVIFDKINENIKDMVDVYIQDAKGVTLLGNRVLEKELAYEVN